MSLKPRVKKVEKAAEEKEQSQARQAREKECDEFCDNSKVAKIHREERGEDKWQSKTRKSLIKQRKNRKG